MVAAANLENHNPKKFLKDIFGFDSFKGNQEAVIHHMMSGNDCFVIMPTGAGKSLCYQLPAMMMEGTAIVISPLIALMKNQVDNLRGFSQNSSLAHFLNSSLNKSELQKVHQDVVSGETKLLYVAPETLKKSETLKLLSSVKISFVAVDEAHCISTWGHDFRPNYLKVRKLKDSYPGIPIIALTATAVDHVHLTTVTEDSHTAGPTVASLDGTLMSLENELFKLTSTGAKGIWVKADGNHTSTLYVGKSLFDTINEFGDTVLISDGDIDKRVKRYSEDISDQKDQLTSLETRMENERARYMSQFTAMESAVSGFKETQSLLTNMMDAWTAGMKN